MKLRKLYITTRIISLIVTALGSNMLCNGTIRDVNPLNVRGIILKSVQMIFDGDYTRESISEFNDIGKLVVLDDSVSITKFFDLLNDCSSIDVGRGDVMSDLGIIMFSDGEPFEANRGKMEPKIFGLIYFDDGRPTKPFWINYNHIEIDDDILILSEKMKSYLWQEISKNPVDKDFVIEVIHSWDNMYPKSSNICGIEVYSLVDDDNPVTTRHTFIKSLRNGLAQKIQIYNPNEIKIINERLASMKITKTFNYSVLSTQKNARIGSDGRMIWEEYSSPVTGFLKIIRDNESAPELIWITPTNIERDHYQLTVPSLTMEPLEYILH